MIVGCQPLPENMTDDHIRKLAWDAFDESDKGSIVGSRDDIIYEVDSTTGVTTIINNASEEVWKLAEISYLNENQILGVTERLKVSGISNKIAAVSFKTLVGEFSNIPYSRIVIYIDVQEGVVIGRENGNLHGNLQF